MRLEAIIREKIPFLEAFRVDRGANKGVFFLNKAFLCTMKFRAARSGPLQTDPGGIACLEVPS